MSRKKSFEEEKKQQEKNSAGSVSTSSATQLLLAYDNFPGKAKVGGQQFLFVLHGGGGVGGLLFKSGACLSSFLPCRG